MAIYYEQKNIKLSCYNDVKLSELPHFHFELEMIVCFSGKVECFLNGQNFGLSSGDILIVFPNQVHNYLMVENGDFLIITFYHDLIPNMKDFFEINMPVQSKVSFEKSSALKQLVFALKENYDETVDNSETQLIGYLNMIMFYLKPLLVTRPLAEIRKGNFEKICNYCIHNFKSKITLELLSKELHLSSQRISHIFNQNMRLTIPQYVSFLRISEACQMLTKTSYTVAEISEDVGFESLRSFNRAFYKINKTTPSKFRMQNTKKTSKSMYV